MAVQREMQGAGQGGGVGRASSRCLFAAKCGFCSTRLPKVGIPLENLPLNPLSWLRLRREHCSVQLWVACVVHLYPLGSQLGTPEMCPSGFGADFCEDRALLWGIDPHLPVLHLHASSFSLHPFPLSHSSGILGLCDC